MIVLSRRTLLAVAAVLDIALNARPLPVAARALALRHNLPPRHLETILQALVRHGLLKGTRGARGGYELARDRRRLSIADIVRAVAGGEEAEAGTGSHLVDSIVAPTLAGLSDDFLAGLDRITIEDLYGRAVAAAPTPSAVDFTI